MAENTIDYKYEKTDEINDLSDCEDEIPTKFTVLDVLRMLAGLLILYGVCCKLWSGNWYSMGSKTSMSSSYERSLLEIPQYWLHVKQSRGPFAFSLEELSQFSGDKSPERILLSVRGHVFDVTSGSRFYGKWGAYRKFTGTDCSKLFSYPQWDMSVLGKQCSSDLSDSTSTELARVDSWLQFFQKKYPEIGYVEELLDS
ncbi:hypothetical protein HG536_0C05980 [Torulaspora globosa]|uniref:Cytochrome b5 heme-binding domain-containing protein n=1 Tax=Torulaspora globosa TaxID=48254 RepID=A0A7G3ZFZ3_9SACH|nr:uncharacterized protein HG536_0C05980 [Torulaspora globosa]QLL32429.1 hypothetical protein HG536_0C05980 [Torulaspora globosa]